MTRLKQPLRSQRGDEIVELRFSSGTCAAPPAIPIRDRQRQPREAFLLWKASSSGPECGARDPRHLRGPSFGPCGSCMDFIADKSCGLASRYGSPIYGRAMGKRRYYTTAAPATTRDSLSAYWGKFGDRCGPWKDGGRSELAQRLGTYGISSQYGMPTALVSPAPAAGELTLRKARRLLSGRTRLTRRAHVGPGKARVHSAEDSFPGSRYRDAQVSISRHTTRDRPCTVVQVAASSTTVVTSDSLQQRAKLQEQSYRYLFLRFFGFCHSFLGRQRASVRMGLSGVQRLPLLRRIPFLKPRQRWQG